jgi:hypothetical protein
MKPYRAVIKSEETVELSIDLVARWFCELDDEQQADFFIAVAARAQAWPRDQGYQWYLVGRHLVNCSCGTPEALALVEELSNGIRAAQNQRSI